MLMPPWWLWSTIKGYCVLILLSVDQAGMCVEKKASLVETHSGQVEFVGQLTWLLGSGGFIIWYKKGSFGFGILS